VRERASPDIPASVLDGVDASLSRGRDAVLHRLKSLGRVAGPLDDLPEDAERCARAKGSRRVARELLVGEVRVVLDRPGRLDDVDPSAPFADRELGAPGRGVERLGQVDELRVASLAKVRSATGLDQLAQAD
jgi:hypothetical protein